MCFKECIMSRDQPAPIHRQRVHVLRGRMVRVAPSDDQLARRGPIALTARDGDILCAAYTQGFLTTDLIVRAFFPPARGRRGPCAAAYERVRELWLWGYLDRVQLPVAPSLGGSRLYLYTLGQRGVPPVAARRGLGGGTAPVQRRRLARLDDLFVEHDLKAAAFWANLTGHLRHTRIRRWAWWSERDLRARHEHVADPHGRRRLPFLADAAMELTYPEGERRVALLEVDQGTQPLRRFRLKVRAFEQYLAQGLFSAPWGRKTFEVFVITTSPRRLANLWRVARDEVAPGRHYAYSFAAADVLDPARFDDYDWLMLENERLGLLYRTAYASLAGTAGEWVPGGDPGGAAAEGAAAPDREPPDA
jgi:hypothetical protein